MPLHADSHTGNRVLITGASGFVGSALMTRLLGEGLPACGVVHTRPLALACVQGPALESGGDWSALLEGVGTVVHSMVDYYLALLIWQPVSRAAKLPASFTFSKS